MAKGQITDPNDPGYQLYDNEDDPTQVFSSLGLGSNKPLGPGPGAEDPNNFYAPGSTYSPGTPSLGTGGLSDYTSAGTSPQGEVFKGPDGKLYLKDPTTRVLSPYAPIDNSNKPVDGYTPSSGGGSGAQGATQSGSLPGGNPYDFSGLEALLQQQISDQRARDAKTAAYNDSIHSSILGTINQYSKPLDENDPNVGAATRAYNAEGQRALALEREALAEHAHAAGASSGSVESGVKQGYQNLAQNVGSYKAKLMIQQLTEQRQMLQGALSTGAGLLSSEEAQGVQERLGNINAQLQKYGIVANTGLAKEQMALQSQLGNRSLDLQATGQGNQNSQFYDQLAFNYGSQNNTIDQLMALYKLQYGR